MTLVWGCDGPRRDGQSAENDASADRDRENEEASTSVVFEKPERPAPPPAGYVGSASCKECHEDVCAEFADHPMGNSLTSIDKEFLAGIETDATFSTRPAARSSLLPSYRVEATDDQMFHHEVMTLPTGQVVYDLKVPVDIAVGSGAHGHSFLVNRDGVLTMSPLTWYADGKGWDLSPGYEFVNLHFQRRVVDLCVACHSGRVNNDPDQPDQYLSPAFLEEAIGCESCHGPGEEHVDFHTLDQGGVDPLVKLGELSDWKLNQICFQCHLNDDLRLTRYGRTDFDFRPGDDLSDVWVSFVEETQESAKKSELAVGQVQQMMESQCYIGSEGAMKCITCHDPHSVPQPGAIVEHYRSACVSCHDSDDNSCAKPIAERLEVTSEDSCIQCHMTKRESTDVVHVAHTDHRISRFSAAESEEESTDKEKVKRRPGKLEIFGGEHVQLPEHVVARATAIAIVRRAERTGLHPDAADAIPVLQEWVKVAPDDVQAQVALCWALAMVGDDMAALRVVEKAAEHDPDNEYYLRELLVRFHQLGAVEEPLEYGRRLVEVNPYDFEYQGRLSHALGQSGDLEAAIDAGEKAVEMNPSDKRLREWLGNLYEAVGKPEEAKRHRDILTMLEQ